jgi:hypothetical protein
MPAARTGPAPRSEDTEQQREARAMLERRERECHEIDDYHVDETTSGDVAQVSQKCKLTMRELRYLVSRSPLTAARGFDEALQIKNRRGLRYDGDDSR